MCILIHQDFTRNYVETSKNFSHMQLTRHELNLVFVLLWGIFPMYFLGFRLLYLPAVRTRTNFATAYHKTTSSIFGSMLLISAEID